MRRTKHVLWALLATVVGLGTTLACTGGPGDLPQFEDPNERHVGARESPGTEVENPTRSTDPAPVGREPVPAVYNDPEPGSSGNASGSSAGGGSTAACAGTFSCTQSGDHDTSRITLVAAGGSCVTIGFTLAANGSVVVNGKNIGSWQPSSDGFTISSSQGSAECVRVTTTSPVPTATGRGGASLDGG